MPRRRISSHFAFRKTLITLVGNSKSAPFSFAGALPLVYHGCHTPLIEYLQIHTFLRVMRGSASLKDYYCLRTIQQKIKAKTDLLCKQISHFLRSFSGLFSMHPPAPTHFESRDCITSRGFIQLNDGRYLNPPCSISTVFMCKKLDIMRFFIPELVPLFNIDSSKYQRSIIKLQ